jgi:hypothetical protein
MRQRGCGSARTAARTSSRASTLSTIKSIARTVVRGAPRMAEILKCVRKNGVVTPTECSIRLYKLGLATQFPSQPTIIKASLRCLPICEIARVFVCFDHVASRIVTRESRHHVSDCKSQRIRLRARFRSTTPDRMATHRKSDRSRAYLCAGGLRKHALEQTPLSASIPR